MVYDRKKTATQNPGKAYQPRLHCLRRKSLTMESKKQGGNYAFYTVLLLFFSICLI